MKGLWITFVDVNLNKPIWVLRLPRLCQPTEQLKIVLLTTYPKISRFSVENVFFFCINLSVKDVHLRLT